MGRWLIAYGIDPSSNKGFDEDQVEERHEADGSDEIGAERMNKDVPEPKSN